MVQHISVLGAGNEGEHDMVCDPTKLKIHGLSMRCFLLSQSRVDLKLRIDTHERIRLACSPLLFFLYFFISSSLSKKDTMLLK